MLSVKKKKQNKSVGILRLQLISNVDSSTAIHKNYRFNYVWKGWKTKSCSIKGVRTDICCGSTRCDFPLTGNHAPTGCFDPWATWCCLWTVLTPPALLFLSLPPSITLFMCVLMQPSANIDASSGFDAANGLYAFLKYIFGDIWKDRCGRIRRCEWRAV